MRYTPRETSSPDGELFFSLEPLIRGMGLSLVELNVFHMKRRGVQVRVVVFSGGNTGVDECSRVHRSIMPRLELAFSGQDIYLEVSSPGIDRIIKDAGEFVHYIGRGVNCYRTDISDWTGGILLSADDKKIELQGGDGEITLPYEIIAKARLNGAVLPKGSSGA